MTKLMPPWRSVEEPKFEQTWTFGTKDTQWMLGYWNSLRGGRICPKLSDVDLLSVHQQARHMTVKDSIDGGSDFLVRFWGTELTSFLKCDPTGQRLSVYFPPASAESALETHRLALTGDMPVRRWGDSQFPDRGMAKFEMILLPLENAAGERAHVITLCTFNWIKQDQ